MRRQFGCWTLGGLLLTSGAAPAQDELEFDWFAVAQLTAEQIEPQNGQSFGSDRLRLHGEAMLDRFTGVVQLDLGEGDLGERAPGSFANVINDLYVSYDLGAAHALHFGEYKMPLGMDFNISGHLLDITKRGMEAGLVLQRNTGVMISARELGRGFGYDVGLFSIAGRSPATRYLDSQEGEDNAYAARLHYDEGPWHAELAYGETPAAGGPGTADYRVTDFAAVYRTQRFTAKAEWIEGRRVFGDPGREETVYYLHAGYDLNPALELLARHYEGKSRVGGASTELSNTFLGFTWLAHETGRMQGRLQVNYVLAGRDEVLYTGVAGFRDDALLVQFQFYVER